MSSDCGGEISALNSGKKVNEFMFHPTQASWALAASWTSCAEFANEPCKIYKELYVTTNLGQEWKYLTNYIFDFDWGQSKHAQLKGVSIPDKRIFVTRDETARGHQREAKSTKWSVMINLYTSDDFFETSSLLLHSGNTIVKTPQYMFIAVSHSDQSRIQIYSSNYESGFTTLKHVRLPRDAVLSNTFTLMDTSEEQVFLFIENQNKGTPYGNLYISDEKGRHFTLSISNVLKTSAVDFEKINSLDGTFVVNRYNKGKAGLAKPMTFSEEDMVREDEKKSRLV